jgi:hypothetical protein
MFARKAALFVAQAGIAHFAAVCIFFLFVIPSCRFSGGWLFLIGHLIILHAVSLRIAVILIFFAFHGTPSMISMRFLTEAPFGTWFSVPADHAGASIAGTAVLFFMVFRRNGGVFFLTVCSCRAASF